MKNKKAVRKRDIYMISILMLVFGALFFVFQYVIFAGDAVSAYIYYGVAEPIVTVNFTDQEVIRNFDQEVPEGTTKNYPLINLDGEDGYVEITLLGAFELDGTRQEVVISVDFSQNRIKVKEEESPLNICSKQGWSTAVPLICLPNRVRVEFDSSQSDVDFIQ